MKALEALLNYQQADEEGIMVLVSRQAIHEAADEIERLRAENGKLLLRVTSAEARVKTSVKGTGGTERLQPHPIFAYATGYHADKSNRLVIDYSEEGAAQRAFDALPLSVCDSLPETDK